MKCTCAWNPYKCPQGKALVANIIKRKTGETDVRTAAGQPTT